MRQQQDQFYDQNNQTQWQLQVKVDFLQQENKQLREEIKDLEQLIKLNKDIIKSSNMQSNNTNSFLNSSCYHFTTSRQQNQAARQNMDSDKQKNFFEGEQKQYKVYQLIADQLFEENEKLYKMLHKATRERDIAQGKALIQQQIAENSISQEVTQYSEQIDNIKILNQLVKEKDQQIFELNLKKDLTSNNIDKNSSIIIRYRDGIAPREETIKLNTRWEVARAILRKTMEQLSIVREEKQEAIKMNTILTTELAKLRCQLQYLNEVPRGGEIIQINEEYEEESLYSEAVFTQRVQANTKSVPPPNLPQLDLVKAKKVQEINLKKQLQQQDIKEQQMILKMQQQSQIQQDGQNQNQNNHTSQQQLQIQPDQLQQQQQQSIIQQQQQQGQQQKPEEIVIAQQFEMKILDRLKMLENELIKTKQVLQEEMLTNKILQDQIEDCQHINNELSSRNEILIESNKNYEKRWQKVFYTLKFYRDFYIKEIQTRLKSKQYNQTSIKQVAEQQDLFIQQMYNDTENNQDKYFSPESLSRFMTKSKNNYSSNYPTSIIEVPEEFISLLSDRIQNQNVSFSQEINKEKQKNKINFEKAKCSLLQLAKELYSNQKVRNVLWNLETIKLRQRSKSAFNLDLPKAKPQFYPLKMLNRLDKPIKNYYTQKQKDSDDSFYNIRSNPISDIYYLEQMLANEIDYQGIDDNHMNQLELTFHQPKVKHAYYFTQMNDTSQYSDNSPQQYKYQ